MPPTLGNGKICYVEMPALSVESSSTFYKDVFGWNVRRRGDGSTAFDAVRPDVDSNAQRTG